MEVLEKLDPANNTIGYEDQFKVNLRTRALFIPYTNVSVIIYVYYNCNDLLILVARDSQTKYFGIELPRCQVTEKSIKEQGLQNYSR